MARGAQRAGSGGALRPDTKVLYMSGWAREAILGRGIMDLGASLLPKPFRPDGILGKVREIYEGRPSYNAVQKSMV